MKLYIVNMSSIIILNVANRERCLTKKSMTLSKGKINSNNTIKINKN